VHIFVLSTLLWVFSFLWGSRTGSASNWRALQEELYKYIYTIQYTVNYRALFHDKKLLTFYYKEPLFSHQTSIDKNVSEQRTAIEQSPYTAAVVWRQASAHPLCVTRPELNQTSTVCSTVTCDELWRKGQSKRHLSRAPVQGMGPSIKYVTLFLANFCYNFWPPSSCQNFVTHPGTPPKVRHISRNPPIVQKTRTKAPCTNSLSIVRGGFYPGAVVRGSFVWKDLSGVVFVRSPFCQNTSVTRES